MPPSSLKEPYLALKFKDAANCDTLPSEAVTKNLVLCQRDKIGLIFAISRITLWAS